MEFKAAWTLPDFATHEEASNIYYYLFPKHRHLSNSKPFGLSIKQNQNNTNPMHAQVLASRPPVKISVRRPSQAQSCCDPMNPSPADCPIIASASRSPVHPARGPPLSAAVASEAFGSPPQNKKKKKIEPLAQRSIKHRTVVLCSHFFHFLLCGFRRSPFMPRPLLCERERKRCCHKKRRKR